MLRLSNARRRPARQASKIGNRGLKWEGEMNEEGLLHKLAREVAEIHEKVG